MDEQNAILAINQFKITNDSSELDKIYGITAEIKELLEEYYIKAKKGKNGALKPLNRLIKQYPHIPQFKNHLSTLYARLGNLAMAKQINEQVERLHPDYLYGKINKAHFLISDNQLDKIPEIFGEKLDLQALYPQRTEFHINEVTSFYKLLFNYAIASKDDDKASTYLEILEELNKNFNIEVDLSAYTIKLVGVRMDNMHQMRQKERKAARFVTVTPKVVGEQTTTPPRFRNELIEELYRNNMGIDQALVQQILQLPRESLLEDLHKVVHDSILRFDYFQNETEWESDTHNFLIHAIFLLIELKEKASLDYILDTLRQENNYFDYWYGDLITEDVWKYLYTFCLNDIEPLRRFMFESGRDPYVRAAASNALVQIALHYPERRNEIINCYREIINELLSREDDDSLIDCQFISFIVSDIADIKAKELTDDVMKLYKNGWVLFYDVGDEEDFLKDLNDEKQYDYKEEVPKTLEEWYKGMKWQNSKEEYEDDEESYEIDHADRRDDVPTYEEMKKMLTSTDETPRPNVGRNDPCPCGSGKKFKKCCLSKYE